MPFTFPDLPVTTPPPPPPPIDPETFDHAHHTDERISEFTYTRGYYTPLTIESDHDRFYFVVERSEEIDGEWVYTIAAYVYANSFFNHEEQPEIVFNIYAVGNWEERPGTFRDTLKATVTICDENEPVKNIRIDDVAAGGEVTIIPQMTPVFVGIVTAEDPDAEDDINGVDPDNRFGEFELSLTDQSSDGLELRTLPSGEQAVYLTSSAYDLRYTNHLSVTVMAKDNPGADEDERRTTIRKFKIKINHELTVHTDTNSVSLDEDETLIFGKAFGNAIAVFGSSGKTLNVTLTVDHGMLTTGGQVIGTFATESTIDPVTGKHSLSFSRITEHELTALLEGMTYTPKQDYFGADNLKLTVTPAGGTTLSKTIALNIRAVDDAPVIKNFGNKLIYQDNSDKIVAWIDRDFFISERTDLQFSDFVLKEVREIPSIRLDDEQDVIIEDKDGFTAAGAKLFIRIVESVPRLDGPNTHEFVKIRESLLATETGVYKTGQLVKYRATAGQEANQDVVVASISRKNLHQDVHAGEKSGYFTARYTFEFRKNSPITKMQDDAWEALQKKAITNLLNIVEVDSTLDLPIEEAREEFGPVLTGLGFSAVNKLYTTQKTLVTFKVQDGKNISESNQDKAVSDEASIFVVNDQKVTNWNSSENFHVFTTVEEWKGLYLLGVHTKQAGDKYYFEVQQPPNPYHQNTLTMVSADPIGPEIPDDYEGFLKAMHHQGRVWTKEDTAIEEQPHWPTLFRYYLPDTAAKLGKISSGYKDGYSVDPMSQSHISAIKKALKLFSDVANINFVEVDTFNPFQVELLFLSLTANGRLGGFSKTFPVSVPTNSKVAVTAAALQNGDLQKLLQTYLHEIGHSLGLRHPGLLQGIEDPVFLSPEQVHYGNTVMAYSNDDGVTGSVFPQQLQTYDITALQHLYGANTQTRNGDTLYDFTTNVSISGYITIYDTGGIDTLDFNNPDATTGIILHMTPGGDSIIRGDQSRIRDFVIYRTSIIENAVGTKHDDQIHGNSADNTIEGLDGADLIDGGIGQDTVSYARSETGVSIDLWAEGGVQQLSSSEGNHASRDTLINIENVIGSAFDDIIKGNDEYNRLEGGSGDDTLSGRGGVDTFVIQFGLGKGWDFITDFQKQLDKLVFQIENTDFNNLFTAYQKGLIHIEKPDAHQFDINIVGSEEDGVSVQFTDTIDQSALIISDFLNAIDETENLQYEVV